MLSAQIRRDDETDDPQQKLTPRPARSRLRWPGWAAVVSVVAVLAAGCGGGSFAAGSEDVATSTTAAAAQDVEAEDAPVLPVTATNADGSTTEITDVNRIIPLNGDIAEVVHALGLGDHVVATDVSATYPDEVADLPKVGYQRTLSAEGILSFEPTVLVGTTTAGPPEVLDQLAATVPMVILDLPGDLTEPAMKIRAVADVLGVPGRGEALASDLQERIEAAKAEIPDDGEPPRVAMLYLRGANVQQIAGAGTEADALFEAAGVIDAAAEVGLEGNVPITPEALADVAPDVIVTTTAGLESVGGVDGLLAIPGVAQTPAGQGGRVVDFDDQYLLGFGPRTPDVLTDLIKELHTEQ